MENQQVAIVPTLSVKNGAAAIEFYKQAFGATVLMANTDPDGSVVVEMALGSARFVVADESVEYTNLSPETLGGTPVRIGLLVVNPDAVFAVAVAAGAKVVYPVADQDYGYRVGQITDPFGHQWEIFKSLTE